MVSFTEVESERVSLVTFSVMQYSADILSLSDEITSSLRATPFALSTNGVPSAASHLIHVHSYTNGSEEPSGSQLQSADMRNSLEFDKKPSALSMAATIGDFNTVKVKYLIPNFNSVSFVAITLKVQSCPAYKALDSTNSSLSIRLALIIYLELSNASWSV